MTAVATILTLLFLATFARNRQLEAENRKLRASQAAAKIAGRTEDEEVTAYLEVSAATSPLAKRLLGAVAEVPRLEDGKQAAEDWMHNPDVAVPAEEGWKLFYEEVSAESSDDAKVQAVKAFLRGHEEFSVYEKTRLVALCTSEEGRYAMREVLYPLEDDSEEAVPEPESEEQPLPAFRWSRQRHTALVTATCVCGNPAIDCDDSNGKVYFRCDECNFNREGDGHYASGRAIYILVDEASDDGYSAWRFVNGTWVKASID